MIIRHITRVLLQKTKHDIVEDEINQSTLEKENHLIIISDFGFGEIESYDQVCLDYYSDGTITDELGDILTDEEIEERLTQDVVELFNECDDDSIFVRNDILIEILKIQESYFGIEKCRRKVKMNEYTRKSLV